MAQPRLRLDQLLLEVGGLSLGLGGLLGILGDEAVLGLLDVLEDHREISLGFGELALLLRQGRLLILQRLGRIDEIRLRPGIHVDELRAHRDALLQGCDELLLRCDHRDEALSLGLLLIELRREAGDLGVELREVGGVDTLLAPADAVWDLVGPDDVELGRDRLHLRCLDRGLAPQRLCPK